MAKPSGDYRAIVRDTLPLRWLAVIFSFFISILALTGPLFMIQVYDRVLSSRSVETLTVLTLLVAFLYTIFAVLDYARGQLLARVGDRLQVALDRLAFRHAVLPRISSNAGQQSEAISDLTAIRQLLGSPVSGAILDLPWVPIFLAGLFFFHPLLGSLAIFGGALLIGLTGLNQALGHARQAKGFGLARRADRQAAEFAQDADTVHALGMREAAHQRWQTLRNGALEQFQKAATRQAGIAATTKATRLFLQSAVLALGAWLVIQNSLSPGAMIGASILLGRVLAPVEHCAANWGSIQAALTARRNLPKAFAELDTDPHHTRLPRPAARLDVSNLVIVAPGRDQPSLRQCSFHLEPGQALGVIGPSGAGKSTLARAITGLWPVSAGSLRLDGATLAQYQPDELARLIGYLPQQVRLFEGTVRDNIARLDTDVCDEDVVRAGKQADAHDMILRLPLGYDTPISMANAQLSGGQVQRLGLARAFYGDPVLFILDEPNSNLDNSGSVALNHAIRTMKAEGRSVLIMAHRPAAIQHCDVLMMLEDGVMKAFGPRDEVLRATVLNHENIRRQTGMGGVA